MSLLRVWLLLALILLSSSLTFAQRIEPADVINEEGGAVFITGEADYTFPYFELFLPEPYVVLYDVTGLVERDPDFYPSIESQTFGVITSNPFESPFTYELSLPIRPRGALSDVDLDNRSDDGVMIFAISITSNTWADPFLEERDNFVTGVVSSALISTDVDSYLELYSGKLIVYAADDEQGFPAGYGDDGRLFTDDDPIVLLPQGYTVVDITDAEFTFDRAAEPEVALLETEDAALDDFSDMGYLEAYDAMIELLLREYAFTEYKDIDWDAIDEDFRSRVEEADEADDFEAYRDILSEIAALIPDGHVSGPFNVDAFQIAVSGGLGMAIRELDDGRILITYLTPGGLADQAGIKLGAELIELNGDPIQDAIDQAFVWGSYSTPHNLRLEQLRYVIRFPIGERVTLTYRNPGDDEETERFQAEFDFDSFGQGGYQDPGVAEILLPGELPVEYQFLENGYGYVKIYSFADDLTLTVRIWERFIEQAVLRNVPGVIVDMRDNGGGSGFLGDQLPAYFFDEPLVIGNSARYSAERDGFYVNPDTEDTFMLPDETLRYLGPVTVLISPDCASACESFSYAMTLDDRAIIVGQYPTAGLGGSVVPIAMPDDLTFNYTNSRSLDSEGNISIEGIGVVPTVLVPVTEETLFAADDVILQAAFSELDALTFGTEVNIGDTVEGEIVDGEPVRYSISAAEGEGFNLILEADDRDQFVIRLYLRDGFELARESDEGNPEILDLNPRQDLDLVIEIDAVDDDFSGEFELRIEAND